MDLPINFVLRSFIFAVGVGLLTPLSLSAVEKSQESWGGFAETRLREIYEQGKYRAAGFNAEWLSDSTGYIVRERVPRSSRTVPVKYEVMSGERQELALPIKPSVKTSGPNV